MAGPTRISELSDGSPVQPTDQVPVARGSGATGYTYKVNAGRFVSDLFNVQNTSTVDLTFDTSTRTLCAAANIPEASVNVVDSPTIDLDWNASTRTLSANASYLLTLINTLSTNMQNIGNYPYLEYAWVTAPNAAGQTITANTETVLNITAELQDSSNLGSVSTNQITLPAGTYRFEMNIPVQLPSGAQALASIKTSTGNYLSRKRYTGGWRHQSDLYYTTYPPYFLDDVYGQFTINSDTTITVNLLTSYAVVVGKGTTNPFDGSAGAIEFTSNTSTQDQRTTIKLWKVG